MQALSHGRRFAAVMILGLVPTTVTVSTSFGADRAEPGALSEADLAEIRRIETRIESGELPQLPVWNCCSGPGAEGIEELIRVGIPETFFVGSGDLAPVVAKAGGLKKYKADVATLLDSRDTVVRRYAATMLADLGAAEYTDRLIELATRRRPREDGSARDREAAAMALGVFGDKHAPLLLKLIEDPEPFVRAGAARGLAWMNAGEHRAEIAKLLDDDETTTAHAAVWSLGKLKAVEYAGRLFDEASTGDRAYLLREPALAALAAMQARDQAPKIAELAKSSESDDEFRGAAIVTLALLDAREFIPTVAAMLDDADFRTRAHAATALGIWKATEQAAKLRAGLETGDDASRHAAAWALIVMESKEHAAAALAAHRNYSNSNALGMPWGIPFDQYQRWITQFKKSKATMQAAVAAP